MAVPPSKRARANTAGEPSAPSNSNTPDYDLETAINALDQATVRQILKAAATAHGSVAQTVRDGYHLIVLKDQARVIDFDHFSKSVWKDINITHRSKKGSYQYEAAFDVSSSVSKTISYIATQVKPHSSLATKQSALETLRKIGKTIVLSEDTIGHEVRKQFQNEELADAMKPIVDGLTHAEREVVLKGEFPVKLEELVDLAGSYCVHEGLKEVLDQFLGGEDGRGHGDDDDEETDDDE